MAKNIEINIKGSDGNYEVLYPKTNSSTTVINQNIINQFGLAEGSGLEDVLGELGKYNEYWWKRRNLLYTEQKTPVDTQVLISMNNKIMLKIANNISINQNSSEITLNNPENFNIGSYYTTNEFRNRLQELLNKAPCYVTGLVNNPAVIYYLPANGTLSYSTNDATTSYTICFYYNNVSTNRVWFGRTANVRAQVVSPQAQTGLWQYVQSSNRNTYPDSGAQYGYEYEYLGVPFDNMVIAGKIETGSYVGTGEYGQANPNTLTFMFKPKKVMIVGNSFYISTAFIPFDGDLAFVHNSTDSATWKLTRNENTISWYVNYAISSNGSSSSISSEKQLNYKDITYYYIAIG